jgi:hypothetical protein
VGAFAVRQWADKADGTILLSTENGDVMTSFDQTPDMPEPFGYKVSWFAIKTSDPAAVIDALELGEAVPANWASGLAAAYERESDSWMFVSPPVDGWVFAVSPWLPYPTVETHHDIGRKFDAMFSRLMSRFDDVQFFGSYRVSDFSAWARALKGKPVRIFAYSGSDSEVLMNFGEQTSGEAKLGLVDLTGLLPTEANNKMSDVAAEQDAEEERLVASGLSFDEAHEKAYPNGRHAFPDENDVVELAGLWSVDPALLSDRDDPLSLGLAVRLPANMRE